MRGCPHWMFALSLLAGGCEVGTITGSSGPDDPAPGADAGDDPDPDPNPEPGDPDAAPPDFAMAVSPDRADLLLDQSVDVVVSITSDHYAGPVTLAVSGIPATWELSYEPADTVELTAGGTAAITVRVAVPPDGDAANAVMRIDGTGDIGPREAYFPINVANEVQLVIPPGTGSGVHPFPPTLPLRVGTTVTFVNSDGQLHRIHSSIDGDGFPHESEPGMAPGESFSVQPSAARAFDYYCHEHDSAAGSGLLLVGE